MRILVVGAGAIGGYFGARLLEAGRDVTFLVRPHRAAELSNKGLVIQSPVGDITIRSPPTVLAGGIGQPFDLILLSCKAYDLASAMDSFAAAVGPDTLVLPALNGMKHLDLLRERFGPSSLLGGTCAISVTRDSQGTILHLNESHTLSFGELNGELTARIRGVDDQLLNSGFDAQLSDQILQGMWDKWVFLATLAGITCLMRASIGDIVASRGGTASITALLAECRAIAENVGFAPSPTVFDQALKTLTSSSPITASMLRDLEANAPVEADHIVGDLLQRGSRTIGNQEGRCLLSAAYLHLKAYEARGGRPVGTAANTVPRH